MGCKHIIYYTIQYVVTGSLPNVCSFMHTSSQIHASKKAIIYKLQHSIYLINMQHLVL